MVEKIVVNKDEDYSKKIKLDIIFKTGTTLKAFNKTNGKKYHLEEYLTTFCLLNDIYKFTRGINIIKSILLSIESI